MDSEAEAIITRVYYEFQNGLEPSIDIETLIKEEKDPPKEKKIIVNKSSVRVTLGQHKSCLSIFARAYTILSVRSVEFLIEIKKKNLNNTNFGVRERKWI